MVTASRVSRLRHDNQGLGITRQNDFIPGTVGMIVPDRVRPLGNYFYIRCGGAARTREVCASSKITETHQIVVASRLVSLCCDDVKE